MAETKDATTPTTSNPPVDSGSSPGRGRSLSGRISTMFVSFLWGTRRVVERSLSVLVISVGFATNAIADLRRGGVLRRLEWRRELSRLEDYLKDSGIEKEMSAVLNRRFLTNMTIYDDVRRAIGRDRTGECSVEDDDDDDDDSSWENEEEEGARFMRYATAVYGPSMIKSVLLERVNDDADEAAYEKAADDAVSKVSAYALISNPEDVVAMDVEEGASMDLLRHFVVVDHERRALVLAVRGTFSVSELVTDLIGFTKPFCGGEAHAAMADSARKLWDKVKDRLLAKLETLPSNYELVVTGHSLGAGVACLINILVRTESAVPASRRVRCFAYAPPPVFAPLDAAPPGAVESTVAYVHDDDVVPFLSVHSVRRFFAEMKALDSRTKSMWLYEKIAVDWELRAPPFDAVDAVRAAEKAPLANVKGATRVMIPARVVRWLRPAVADENDESSYDCFACDPSKMASLSLFLDGPSIIANHFPNKYEVALRSMRRAKRK